MSSLIKVSDKPFYFEPQEDAEFGKRGVLLFHSFTSTPVDVRGVGRALSKLGYTVRGVMFSYHGGDIEDTLVDPQTWIQDGRDAVAAFKEEGFDQVAVFGVSLGGIVSHKLIMEQEGVIGGGSICSPMIAGYSTNTPKDFWVRFKREKQEADWSAEEIENRRDEINAGVLKVLDALDQVKLNMHPHFGKVAKPIFIAQGGDDQIIDPAQAIELRDLYTNTDVDFHWFEEGGHLLSIGKFRQPLIDAMAEFLDKLDWD